MTIEPAACGEKRQHLYVLMTTYRQHVIKQQQHQYVLITIEPARSFSLPKLPLWPNKRHHEDRPPRDIMVRDLRAENATGKK